MLTKPQSWRYIGDAAANACCTDVIIRRDGRYIVTDMGIGATNGDWYLIEESQPQYPMFRTKHITNWNNIQKCHRAGDMNYYACKRLFKNYSSCLHYIESLGEKVFELESISWLGRRWRLFPVNKVTTPPPSVQQDLESLSAWFHNDTTSVLVIQPTFRMPQACVASWLNMHKWAPRDIRKLLMSRLDYNDMIMVEAAHGLMDKCKLVIAREIKYPSITCWLVRNQHVSVVDALQKGIMEWHRYFAMEELIDIPGMQLTVACAIQHNHSEFIHAMVAVVPLYRFRTGGKSFAEMACRCGNYDLMIELMLPEDLDDIYHELVKNNNTAIIARYLSHVAPCI